MATLRMLFAHDPVLSVSDSSRWTIASATQDKVILQSGLDQLVVSGSFRIGPAGELASGSATSLELYHGGDTGHKAFEATGLASDATRLVYLIRNAADSADIWSSIFSGADMVIGSDDSDWLQAFAGNDTIQAGQGDDYIHGSAGNDKVDGGAGFDVAIYRGAYGDARLERGAAGYTLTDLKGDGGVDTLANVERINFDDKYVALIDVDDTSGAVFRLYQAAFGRNPDEGGLHYWTYQVDVEHLGLAAVAAGFVKSAEHQALYGAGLSNREVVGQYYEHILHRPAEQGGLDFWAGVLDSQAATRAEVLAAISESPESVAFSVQLIGNGLVFDMPVIVLD